MLIDSSPYVALGLTTAVLVWDVTIAGWIVARHQGPRLFAQLSAFCGLLVIPMMLVGSAAGTADGARTIAGITWLLPVVMIAVAIQSLYAVARRLVAPRIGVPMVLYNLLIVHVTVADYVVARTGYAPEMLQAAIAARAAVLGLFGGPAALISPLALLAPMLAPADESKRTGGRAIRSALALLALGYTAGLLIAGPGALRALRSYDRAFSTSIPSRPRDLRVGVRLLPPLSRSPSPRQVRDAGAVLRVFRPDVVLLVLDAEAVRPTVLDSLQRVLTSLQIAPARLAIAFRLHEPRLPRATDPMRQRAIEQIVGRLRPAVFFPALADPITGWSGAPRPSVAWWRNTLEDAAAIVDRTHPTTRIAWSASRFDMVDSAVYAWAVTPEAPVDLLAAASYPSFDGLAAMDAPLHTFERWQAEAARAHGATPWHWLVTVGGLPHAHGDRAQAAAIRYALAWGARRPWITGIVIGDAGDDVGRIGLRAADGRPRDALDEQGLTARAVRSLR